MGKYAFNGSKIDKSCSYSKLIRAAEANKPRVQYQPERQKPLPQQSHATQQEYRDESRDFSLGLNLFQLHSSGDNVPITETTWFKSRRREQRRRNPQLPRRHPQHLHPFVGTLRRPPQPPRHDNDCGERHLRPQTRHKPQSRARRPPTQSDKRLLQMAHPDRPNLRVGSGQAIALLRGQICHRSQHAAHPRRKRPRLPHRLPPPEILHTNPSHATPTSHPRRGGVFTPNIKSREMIQKL